MRNSSELLDFLLARCARVWGIYAHIEGLAFECPQLIAELAGAALGFF